MLSTGTGVENTILEAFGNNYFNKPGLGIDLKI